MQQTSLWISSIKFLPFYFEQVVFAPGPVLPAGTRLFAVCISSYMALKGTKEWCGRNVR